MTQGKESPENDDQDSAEKLSSEDSKGRRRV